jgi:hypothetical protein
MGFRHSYRRLHRQRYDLGGGIPAGMIVGEVVSLNVRVREMDDFSIGALDKEFAVNLESGLPEIVLMSTIGHTVNRQRTTWCK